MKPVIVVFLCLFAWSQTRAQIWYKTMQAAYIYNFCKYIQWTAASEDFVIGIYGKDDIMDDLEDILKDKKLKGKNISLTRISKPQDFLKCQIIYLTKSKSKQIALVSKAIEGKPILLVSEDDLADQGAGISFFTENEKLRIRCNLKTLQRQKLEPSQGLINMSIVLR